MNLATVSRVYPHEGKHRFYAGCGDNAKGYEYEVKKEAVKARARLIKRLKVDNFKVLGVH